MWPFRKRRKVEPQPADPPEPDPIALLERALTEDILLELQLKQVRVKAELRRVDQEEKARDELRKARQEQWKNRPRDARGRLIKGAGQPGPCPVCADPRSTALTAEQIYWHATGHNGDAAAIGPEMRARLRNG